MLHLVRSGSSPMPNQGLDRIISEVQIQKLIDRDTHPYYFTVRDVHKVPKLRKSNSTSVLLTKQRTPQQSRNPAIHRQRSVKPMPDETPLMQDQTLFNTEQKTQLNLIDQSHSNNFQPRLQTMHPLSKLHTLSSPSKRPISRSQSVF